MAPFRITKKQVKLADERVCTIICSVHIDFIPRAYFSKTNFESRDWKQVSTHAFAICITCREGFVCEEIYISMLNCPLIYTQIAAQGILKYCLSGFLDKQQRDTLIFGCTCQSASRNSKTWTTLSRT